jgi:hypothetical protein
MESTDKIDSIQVVGGKIEAIIEGSKYTSHPSDEVVMVDEKGVPIYLMYQSNLKVKRILSINTTRITLHWQFEQLCHQEGKTYHLRKSTMIPGLFQRTIPRC